jgi:hypothetical protein
MSISELPEAFHYLQSRADHHRTRSFREEYLAFLKKHELAEIRGQILLDLSNPSAVPPGRGRVFHSSSRHFVPGYFQAVPPSFVPPFHEKTRRRIDYGGQAGTGIVLLYQTRHFVPGYFQAVPPPSSRHSMRRGGGELTTADRPGRAWFHTPNQALRSWLLSRCPFLLRLTIS